MKGIIKYIPYFYFVVAGLLFMNTIQEYQEETESYEILFSFKTESSTTFLTIRIVFILLVIFAGLARLKRLKSQS